MSCSYMESARNVELSLFTTHSSCIFMQAWGLRGKGGGGGVVSGLSTQSHLPCFIPLPDGHCNRLSRSMPNRYTLEQFCASNAQACTKFNVDFVVVEGSMKHKKQRCKAVGLSAVAMQSTSALDSMM